MDFYVDFRLSLLAETDTVTSALEMSETPFGSQSDAIEAAEDFVEEYGRAIVTGYTVTAR